MKRNKHPRKEHAVSGASYEKKPKKRRSSIHSDQFEMVIHHSIIVDQVASFLYAVGLIGHKKDIIDIKFGSTKDELTTITVFYKEGNKD